jgi:beta-lactamase class A
MKIIRVSRVLILAFGLLSVSVYLPAYSETLNKNTDSRPLYDLVDKDLQKQLEKKVNSDPTLRKLAKSKRLAIGLVDLSGDHPRFARINGNKMMYAASLPKIAILLAAYESFEDGSLAETKEVHEDLTAMIRYSSNVAATKMIDRIGMNKINAVLKNPKYELYDEDRGGGLWVGKRYAAKGARRPDPINGISHGATVTQICRFYYLLSEKRLVSKRRSEQMLEDLSDPGLHHKFVNSLDLVAPNAKLYRKSGTWRTYHSDSVLVKGKKWRNYILTAMVESSNGSNIIKSMVPLAEQTIKSANNLKLSKNL